MVAIDIRIDGTSIVDHVLFSRTTFTAQADGQAGTASITLDNSDRSITPDDLTAGSTLELYVDGTRTWDGWIFGIRRSWPFDADETNVPTEVPRFWTITGYDRNILFQKRLMYRVSDPSDNRGFKIWDEDTPDRTAIEYALANYVDLTGDGITWDIEQIASPGPFEEFTLGFVSAPMGVLFDDCAKITGGVYFIGPDRVGRYVDDTTPTAPFVLSDVNGAGKVNYRECIAGRDFTECANEALVWGAGKGSDEAVFAKYTDTDSVTNHGLWQWGELYIGAWKQKTVNRRARTYVEGSPSHRRGHNDPLTYVTCTIFEPGLLAGHVVTFESQIYEFSENLPVRQVNMSFPTTTSIKYELTLTLKIDTPFGVPDPWKLAPWETDGNTRTEYLPPEGTTAQPGAGIVEVDRLIDHFDTATEFIAAAEEHLGGPFTWPAPPPYDDIYFPTVIPVPSSAVAGDTIVIFMETWQLYLQPPSGWEVISRETGSEDTRAGSYAILKTLASETSFQFTLVTNQGQIASPGTYTAHVLLLKGVTDYVLERIDPVEAIAWSWDGQAELLLNATPFGSTSIVLETYYTGEYPELITRTGTRASSPSEYLPETLVIALHHPGTAAALVTPGPEVTLAPWPGGNEWTITDHDVDIPDPPSWEVVDSRATVYSQDYNGDVIFELLSGEYYLLDDPTGAVTGHAGVVQGDWASDYGQGDISGPTPWGPWQHPPFTLTWKVRLTDLTEAQILAAGEDTYAQVQIRHAFTIFDDGPDLAYWSGVGCKTAWRGTYQVTFEAFRDGSDVAAYIQANNTITSFDRGIMAVAVPDPSTSWEIGTWPEPGDEWFTKTRAWQHTWGKVFDIEEVSGSDWYIKTHVGEMVHPEGGIEFKVKVWKEGTPEPDWMYEDIIAMCKGNATTYLGYAHEGSSYLGTKFMPDMLNMLVEGFQWDTVDPEDPPPFEDETSIDAIWAMVEEIGTGIGQITSEFPIFDSDDRTEAGLYVTRYPYRPGSLVVYFEGIRLRSGVDYIETDPSSGQFRILGDRDISSVLTVKYTREGTVENATGGNVYRPGAVLQYGWGTPLDGYNCGMACSVMALDRHTLGGYTPWVGSPRSTPPNHRGFQYDQTGGTDLFDIATAWANGWGETLQDVGVSTYAHFITRVEEGRGAILQGLYSLLPANKRFSSFTGPHAIYINERFANGNFLGYDPLYRYPVLYTTDELGVYGGGLPYTGLGNVSAAYTRIAY